MQITILGAAGQIGKVIVHEALKSGYQVKVLVRNSGKLGELRDKVEIVEGNLLDEKAVGMALMDSKAIINVSGAVKEPNQVDKFQKIGRILVEQMKEQNITRLINISLAVIALPQEKLDMQRNALKLFVNLFYRRKKQVQEAVMKIILEDRNIAWTFVRPAMVSGKPGTGKVLADDKKLPGTTIMLEDLGKFMVGQIKSSEWIKKAPLVTSK
jgi:putative NADH-flavin reductase